MWGGRETLGTEPIVDCRMDSGGKQAKKKSLLERAVSKEKITPGTEERGLLEIPRCWAKGWGETDVSKKFIDKGLQKRTGLHTSGGMIRRRQWDGDLGKHKIGGIPPGTPNVRSRNLKPPPTGRPKNPNGG